MALTLRGRLTGRSKSGPAQAHMWVHKENPCSLTCICFSGPVIMGNDGKMFSLSLPRVAALLWVPARSNADSTGTHRQKNKQNKHHYLCIFSCELQHKVFLTLFSNGQDKKPNFRKLHTQDSTTLTSGCSTSLCCNAPTLLSRRCVWTQAGDGKHCDQLHCTLQKISEVHISVALQWK